MQRHYFSFAYRVIYFRRGFHCSQPALALISFRVAFRYRHHARSTRHGFCQQMPRAPENYSLRLSCSRHVSLLASGTAQSATFVQRSSVRKSRQRLQHQSFQRRRRLIKRRLMCISIYYRHIVPKAGVYTIFQSASFSATMSFIAIYIFTRRFSSASQLSPRRCVFP